MRRTRCLRLAAILAATYVITGLAGPAARSAAAGFILLVGDCNRDGVVTIDELILAVGVALGRAPLATCALADANGDGRVAINELISAVNAALASGPPPTAPPSPSVNPTLTPSPESTATGSPTSSPPPTNTSTLPAATATQSPTPVADATATDVPTFSPRPTDTPAVPTATATRSSTPSPSPTDTASATATRSPSPSPQPTDTATPPPSPTGTSTPMYAEGVYDFFPVGGQPCGETQLEFTIGAELPFSISRTVTDVCFAIPTAFDIANVTCTSFSPGVSVETVVTQPDCRLDDPDFPQGQVRLVVSAESGTFAAGDTFFCQVPVFESTQGGAYDVRFRVDATTPDGIVRSEGSGQINVFGLPPSGRFPGDCCDSDDQCDGGFCRDGDFTRYPACCESDCPNGICNAPGFQGACCDPALLPGACVPPP